jgi:lipoate--protein ligase
MKKRNKILEYDDFLLPVIDALRRLGIKAEKNRCSDIAIGGKKISGSAQKATGERVLHHGTLLYTSDLSLLDEITTKNKSVHIQSKASPSAICKVCNISESWEGLGKEGCPFTELPPIESFMEALMASMGAKPEALALTEAEKAEVERICREKYHSWEWTYGKTPHFSFEKEGIFQGEKIRFSYQVRKGRIEDFTIQSPYFSEEEVRALFQGQPFSLELFEEKFSDLAERLKPQDSKEVREVLIGLAL